MIVTASPGTKKREVSKMAGKSSAVVLENARWINDKAYVFIIYISVIIHDIYLRYG